MQALTVISLFVTASADMESKPFGRIIFENTGDELCI